MAAIFAHLHSSPLVVRRRNGSEWRSLSSTSLRQLPSAVREPGAGNGAAAESATTATTGGEPAGLACVTSSGLEPVDIIDVKEERKLLMQCLRESQKRVVWHSEVADLHTFRKVLSFGCRVLHFSGHGVPGKVIFENRKCEAQFVTQRELKELLLAGGMEHATPEGAGLGAPGVANAMRFPDGNDTSGSESDAMEASEVDRGWVSLHPRPRVPVRLVFVSACHSESVADAFVSAGVPHVVVVAKEDKVLDKKAMEFSKAFYTALLAGHSVKRSFEIGHVQADIFTTNGSVMTSNGGAVRDAASSKFKLLGHGDHHEALFRDVPAGEFQVHAPLAHGVPATVNECDAVAEVFVGRSLEVHQVYKSLVEGARLVSLTGERGIGKTEIALQCARYATERRVFQHIYFLRLENSDDGNCDDHGDESRTSTESDHIVGETNVVHGSPTSEAPSLVQRFAKALHVGPAATVNELADLVRDKQNDSAESSDGTFLLILDGCQRCTRRDPRFRAIVSQLLRRVGSLSLLLTGDGKMGAMDGVGEKIIPVEHLPPTDAALLFTLRAPRRLKAHEMGGSSDLAAFAEHPIIRDLRGHPRTICAVAQFLETKDMELDKHEFLNYIIPSVNAGLDDSSCENHNLTTHCFPVLPQECGIESHPRLNHHHHHHHASDPHARTPHGHHHHFMDANHNHANNLHSEPARQARGISMPSLPLQRNRANFDGSGLALETSLSSDPATRLPSEVGHWTAGVSSSSSILTESPPARPVLVFSHSDSDLSRASAPSTAHTASRDPLTLAEVCVLKISECMKSVLEDEVGRRVWATAVVTNSKLSCNLQFSTPAETMQRLVKLQRIPIEWLAPQISRHFATQLRADAATRPLSVRSIDFLTKSSLVWGGRSPSQLQGEVDMEMFAHFWRWFKPLTECVVHSSLWSYTQPRLLHGFLSKGACVNMLASAPPGTFLLRFSETRLQCVVIVYVTTENAVQFVPVTWKHSSQAAVGTAPTENNNESVCDGGWSVSLQEDASNVTFPTLPSLILSVTVLKYLFPQTPKEVAFKSTDRSTR